MKVGDLVRPSERLSIPGWMDWTGVIVDVETTGDYRIHVLWNGEGADGIILHHPEHELSVEVMA